MASTILIDPVESKLSKSTSSNSNTSAGIETKAESSKENSVVKKNWTALQYGFGSPGNTSPANTDIFKLKTDFMKVFDLQENASSKRPYETAKIRNVMNR